MGCCQSRYGLPNTKVTDEDFKRYSRKHIQKKVSLNLALAGKNLVEFVGLVDAEPELYTAPVIERAIARYVKFWVPLFCKALPKDREKLVAPLDVEYVWCCHMLCPLQFTEDLQLMSDGKVMKKTITRVISESLSSSIGKRVGPSEINYEALQKHRVRGEREYKDRLEFSKKYWASQSDTSAEPWDWKSSSATVDLSATKIQYNILEAAQRQMNFNYQVKLPHYTDPKFLTTAAERYVSGFLTLQRKKPDEFWVPTYDIDLIWHAHMLHPEYYNADTLKLLGRVLKHDDSVNDRSEGGKLATGWKNTQKAWSELKLPGEPSISKPGGMWRGNPSMEQVLAIKNLQQIAQGVDGSVGRKTASVKVKPVDTSSVEANVLEVPGINNSWIVGDDVNGLHMRGLEPPRLERASALGSQLTATCYINPRAAAVVLRKRPENLTLASCHMQVWEVPQAPQLHFPDLGIARSQDGSRNEASLVIRVANEDVAIVYGKWEQYLAPVPGKPGVPGNRDLGIRGVRGTRGKAGKPGRLAVRVYSLKTKDWVLVEHKVSNDRAPASCKFSLSPFGAQGEATADLEKGTITCTDGGTVHGGIMGMAFALLHVLLQPRLTPRSDVKPASRSMYPLWGVDQRNFPMLFAAGGEAGQAELVLGKVVSDPD